MLTNLSELSHSLSHPEKGHGMLLQVEHCLQRNSWIEISVINISKYLLIHLQCLNCVSKVKISNRFTKHPFRKFQFALCCNAFMKQKYIYNHYSSSIKSKHVEMSEIFKSLCFVHKIA